MDNTKRSFSSSDIRVYNRERIEIGGVDEILSYDDRTIVLSVCGTRAVIEGENLRVTGLSVEEGKINAVGRLNGFFYEEEIKLRKGFFSKLVKE